MKKLTILIISALFISGSIFAQKGVMKIEPAVIVAFPSESGINMGFGATGTFFYGIEDNIDLTGTIGYISFGYDGFDGTFSTVPFLFGARYSFKVEGTITPYAAAELGFHFTSHSMEIPSYSFFGVTYGGESTSVSSTGFGFGIGGGAYFKVSEAIVIDGNIQYNIISSTGSFNFFSIRGGVIFEI